MMSGNVIVAWLHYMSIMVLFASLLAEHLLLKPQPTLEQAKTLQVLDIVYGGSATAVVITGIIRIFTEKGLDYYLHHGGFHATVGLFVIVGLLSIFPTVVFLRWRGETRAGRAPLLSPERFKALQMTLRLELTLVLLIPLFAAWMARGH